MTPPISNPPPPLLVLYPPFLAKNLDHASLANIGEFHHSLPLYMKGTDPTNRSLLLYDHMIRN